MREFIAQNPIIWGEFVLYYLYYLGLTNCVPISVLHMMEYTCRWADKYLLSTKYMDPKFLTGRFIYTRHSLYSYHSTTSGAPLWHACYSFASLHWSVLTCEFSCYNMNECADYKECFFAHRCFMLPLDDTALQRISHFKFGSGHDAGVA